MTGDGSTGGSVPLLGFLLHPLPAAASAAAAAAAAEEEEAEGQQMDAQVLQLKARLQGSASAGVEEFREHDAVITPLTPPVRACVYACGGGLVELAAEYNAVSDVPLDDLDRDHCCAGG